MITVFYGSQVYEQYETPKRMRNHIEVDNPIYQEGYYYNDWRIRIGNLSDSNWFRVDGTPCLIEDVPKQLQMLALVLNL